MLITSQTAATHIVELEISQKKLLIIPLFRVTRTVI